jgi:hypothetical protein
MERDREREGIRTGAYSQPGREGAERGGEGGDWGRRLGREDGFFSCWSRVLGKERECVEREGETSMMCGSHCR